MKTKKSIPKAALAAHKLAAGRRKGFQLFDSPRSLKKSKIPRINNMDALGTTLAKQFINHTVKVSTRPKSAKLNQRRLLVKDRAREVNRDLRIQNYRSTRAKIGRLKKRVNTMLAEGKFGKHAQGYRYL